MLTTAVGARVDKGLDTLNRVKNSFGSCNDESDCPSTPLSGRGGDGARGRGRGGGSDSNCGQPCLLPLSGQHVSRDNTVVVCSNISAVYSDGPASSDSAQIFQLAQNYQHAETSGLPAGLAADAFFDCLVEAPELSRYRSAPVVKVQLVHIDTSGRQMIVDELQLGNEWLPKDFPPSAYPAVSRSPGGHDPLACSTAMIRIPALCNNTICVSSGNDPQFDMQDWASMYGENCLASPSFVGIEGGCTNDETFSDAQGFQCWEWEGLACSAASSLYTYEELEQRDILRHCQKSCLGCGRFTTFQVNVLFFLKQLRAETLGNGPSSDYALPRAACKHRKCTISICFPFR